MTPERWWVGDGSERSHYEGPDALLFIRDGAPCIFAKINSNFMREETEQLAHRIAAVPELESENKALRETLRQLDNAIAESADISNQTEVYLRRIIAEALLGGER